GWESSLRHGGAPTPERVNYPGVQPRRQVAGLIEAATELPPRMQWHGDEAVRIGEQVRAGITHQPAQRSRQRPAPVVLEGMDDVAQCTGIVTSGARRG